MNSAGGNCVHSITGSVALNAAQMANCIFRSLQKKSLPSLMLQPSDFPYGGIEVETPRQFREQLDRTIEWLLTVYYPNAIHK